MRLTIGILIFGMATVAGCKKEKKQNPTVQYTDVSDSATFGTPGTYRLRIPAYNLTANLFIAGGGGGGAGGTATSTGLETFGMGGGGGGGAGQLIQSAGEALPDTITLIIQVGKGGDGGNGGSPGQSGQPSSVSSTGKLWTALAGTGGLSQPAGTRNGGTGGAGYNAGQTGSNGGSKDITGNASGGNGGSGGSNGTMYGAGGNGGKGAGFNTYISQQPAKGFNATGGYVKIVWKGKKPI